MKRAQLYLDEDLWTVLMFRSRQSGVSISELVRQAIRERYAGAAGKRNEGMQAFIGSREGRRDLEDAEKYIRNLRRGSRLERLDR